MNDCLLYGAGGGNCTPISPQRIPDGAFAGWEVLAGGVWQIAECLLYDAFWRANRMKRFASFADTVIKYSIMLGGRDSQGVAAIHIRNFRQHFGLLRGVMLSSTS